MLPSIRSLQLCNNSRTALRFPSGCLSSCCGAIATPRLLFSPRRYSNATVDKGVAKEKLEEGPPAARFNELGVQQLSAHLHSQIFKMGPTPPPPELIELAREHLNRHELYGKTSDITPPIEFDLPELQGNTLDEHFTKLGMEVSKPYLTMAREFSLKDIPDPPTKWERMPGWTKYTIDDGKPTACKVEAPDDDAVVFDVEVLYKVTPFAIMACAASEKAWYAWLSPWLLEISPNPCHLVSFGDMGKPRVIVGHNVGYDRARIQEEYELTQSKNCFLDTMSLHVAVNGMCSRQRPTWMKHKKNRELKERVEKENHGDDLRAMLNAGLGDDEAEELWIRRSAINSLRDVAKFHCGIELDKEVRDQFGGESIEDISANLDELLGYCAQDVVATHKVYQKVLPEFLRVCSHPVSFAALRHLSSVILPVNKSWGRYIENAENTYQEMSEGVKKRLIDLAELALENKDKPEVYENDEWLRQLDWSGQEIRYLKLRKGETEPRQARQKMPGMPKWYKDLFIKANASINLSVRTRISPILLRLQWDNHPLIWTEKFGWTFRVSHEEMEKYKSSPLVQCNLSDEKNEAIRNDIDHVYYKLPHKDGPASRCATPLAKGYLKYFESQTLSSEYPLAREALEMNAACSYWISARERIRSQMVVYESDFKNAWEGGMGVEAAMGYPKGASDAGLAKSTGSEISPEVAKVSEVRKDGEIVEVPGEEKDVNQKGKSAKKIAQTESKKVDLDVASEMGGLKGMELAKEVEPVTARREERGAGKLDNTEGVEKAEEDTDEVGIILPQLIPMGTITRRAVERTWLTASNAKKNRLGSELKAKVIAPPGYAFVGADVDSQELWIASLLGDAQFKIHGGTALGFMTLEGTKANGTDLHSKTAKILDISRNNAKVFNYGRIYGAGVKFASTLLREFNPTITDVECTETATDLYTKTKGKQTMRKPLSSRRFWRGGTESFVFNTLEEFADQEWPRTPVLGAGITEALMRKNLSKNGFLTSRINWAIQSSGVDYLHLLVVAMDYLIRKFGLQARLAITVHDEIRYLVKEEDKYRAAMALQVANVWTRAMFSEQIGINDLPQSCAFFSAVDIDHVLRKEVDMDCITPTNLDKIPPGESLDIFQLLKEQGQGQQLLDPKNAREIDFKEFEYLPRVPVMEDLQVKRNIYFMKAQISNEDEELENIVTMARNSEAKKTYVVPGNPLPIGSQAPKTTKNTAIVQKRPSASIEMAKDLPMAQNRSTPTTPLNNQGSPTASNPLTFGNPRPTIKSPATTTNSMMAKRGFRPGPRPEMPPPPTKRNVFLESQNLFSGIKGTGGGKERSKSQKTTAPNSAAPLKPLTVAPGVPGAAVSKGPSKNEAALAGSKVP
ncbi:hypothetical protein L873DRAFT_141624 [Choiromyces venosus 120613-1]|uniref:DNA-directed DNA polymerase n=1 Tax=Choiromyces venosus 120613-1 TaxID=1336337 RepID=A0A3N4J7U6_9PEZI|nr:hypothetical protein L873DRAFT_141624 [Choiromyces venosus 120613-1]